MRPALFALDAERAHDLTLAALPHPATVAALRALYGVPRHRALTQHVFGLRFEHPVGLAAGLDKQGTAIPAWAAMGFAFAEIGTVTPRPQPGNPRPRLFRLPSDHAVINRFGFNSAGARGVAANLRAAAIPAPLRVGINVGRNKETPNERATADYQETIDVLRPFADYFVVNVSSPNTTGLRDLQESRTLRQLMIDVVAVAQDVPVLVKVAPDLGDAELLGSADAAGEGGAAGIIATNTTLRRDGVRAAAELAREIGGLSGRPLQNRATDVCRRLYRHLGRRLPIVGVGGIFSADDAYARIRAGATLVQLYTALIYEGPGLVRRLVNGLAERVRRDGFATIAEAVGVDVR